MCLLEVLMQNEYDEAGLDGIAQANIRHCEEDLLATLNVVQVQVIWDDTWS